MTDVSFHYYNAGWQDLTSHLKNFKIEEYGIQRVPQATVTLFGKASDLTAFLASPYKLTRIRAKPVDTWQTLFYGYVDNPFHKALLGMLTDMRVVSLDCFGGLARLATDFITFDYYKLQSAITPLADENAWTYRKMIQDFLDYPDSTRDGTGLSGTGFTVVADNDPDGIDHIIDGSCSWSRQSLLDAIRTTCDQIGYDGYCEFGESVANIHLYPFDKASSGYLYAPYVKEPEYEGGSLNDIANVIFVWGGIDEGVPHDCDRWTEFGYGKYNPKAWSATSSPTDDVTISDTNNDNFHTATVDYGVNEKSVKFLCNTSNAQWIHSILDLTQTAEGLIDCLNRCKYLTFNIFPYTPSYYGFIIVALEDSNGNMIECACIQENKSQNVALFESGEPKTIQLDVGVAINDEYPLSFFYSIYDLMNDGKARAAGNKWYYHSGDTTFDWEHVKKIHFHFGQNGFPNLDDWSFELDGLYFIGGYRIEPFQSYSATLNPPAVDATSISQYGIHPFHYQNAQITSFEQAQAEGARLLNNLKDTIPRMTLSKLLPTTQFRPSNVVTVTGVDYRIANITYEWDTKTKEVHATYKIVGKTNPLPPIWTEQNELRYLVK